VYSTKNSKQINCLLSFIIEPDFSHKPKKTETETLIEADCKS
jgi:hypothetical protein